MDVVMPAGVEPGSREYEGRSIAQAVKQIDELKHENAELLAWKHNRSRLWSCDAIAEQLTFAGVSNSGQTITGRDVFEFAHTHPDWWNSYRYQTALGEWCVVRDLGGYVFTRAGRDAVLTAYGVSL